MFFLMVFASPWHPESGFDGCTRGTLGEIDISKMAAKIAATFTNNHISVTIPIRKMIMVARHRLFGSRNPYFITQSLHHHCHRCHQIPC